jgi:hypothetical protein
MTSFGLRNLVSCLITLLLPAVAFAGTGASCECGPPTAESYKWNFSKEAAGLLAQIHSEAYQAKNAAERLESFEFERQMYDWRADASILNREKYWANDMDRILCRLRTIQRVLPADQQQEIEALTPAVIEVTDTTQAAMQYVRQHQEELFLPTYKAYSEDLSAEASRIEAATATPGKSMAVNQAGNQTALRQNLKAGS